MKNFKVAAIAIIAVAIALLIGIALNTALGPVGIVLAIFVGQWIGCTSMEAIQSVLNEREC